MHWKPWLIILVMMSATLSGCLSDDSNINNGSSSYSSYPEPWDRANLIYDDSDVFSRVSVNGTFNISAPQSVYVPVPTITAADGGAGITGGAEVHLGLWLPEIEGCDFTAGNISEECKVPVLALSLIHI